MIQHEKRNKLRELMAVYEINKDYTNEQFLDDIILFFTKEEKEGIIICKVRNCEECKYEYHENMDEPCKSCDEDACNWVPKPLTTPNNNEMKEINITTPEGVQFFGEMCKNDCDQMAQENNGKWCDFSLYLDKEYDEGKTEFRLVINSDKSFYIHPFGKDGNTFDGKL